MKNRKMVATFLTVMIALLMPLLAIAAPLQQENLLQNSDFEGGFSKREPVEAHVTVADGWEAWWKPREEGIKAKSLHLGNTMNIIDPRTFHPAVTAGLKLSIIPIPMIFMKRASLRSSRLFQVAWFTFPFGSGLGQVLKMIRATPLTLIGSR